MAIANHENFTIEDSVRHIMENPDKTSISCSPDFDIEKIKKKVEEYRIDAVINYSFRNCKMMEKKIRKINELLNESGISSMILQTDYLEIYEKEEQYKKGIHIFLNP